MSVPIFIPLVNTDDQLIGHQEKLAVHEQGLLHRAFSILVHDGQGHWLLHQRALHKYHSGGLWTNTCCGHPNEGESMESAVHRRLHEEMGFDCPLQFTFKFHYEASFSNGLTENEIDHVYIGQFNETFETNPEEVEVHDWFTIEEIEMNISKDPEKFTVWFREIMKYKEKWCIQTVN